MAKIHIHCCSDLFSELIISDLNTGNYIGNWIQDNNDPKRVHIHCQNSNAIYFVDYIYRSYKNGIDKIRVTIQGNFWEVEE